MLIPPGSQLSQFFKETPERAERRRKEQEERRTREEQRNREELERERLKAMPPEYVITLVHGTQLSRRVLAPLVSLFKWPKGLYKEFQEGPPWIQQNSALAQYLTEALGWRVRIEPFSWKAYNTVGARAVATGQLQTKLHQLQEKYPDAEQIVIAHSHGGNVAVSAFADAVDARRILGVATLATPFLTAKTRKTEGLLDVGGALAAALMAGFATLTIGVALGAGWSWWNWALVVCAGVLLLMLGGVWATKMMKKTARSIEEKMRETKLDTEQVTIVRTHGDEAVAVIAGARVTGAFVNLVWRGLSEPVLGALSSLLQLVDYFGLRSMFRKFEEVTRPRINYAALLEDRLSTGPPPSKKPLTFEEMQMRSWHSAPLAPHPPEKPLIWEEIKKAALPFIGPLIVTVFQDPKYLFLKWVVLGIAALYGLPAFLALLLTVISIIPGIVFSIGLLPIGWTVPFAGPYLDITAEPAPPGTWRVTQFEPDGKTGLAHSKSYNEPRVHVHLAGWIKKRVQAKKNEAEKT